VEWNGLEDDWDWSDGQRAACFEPGTKDESEDRVRILWSRETVCSDVSFQGYTRAAVHDTELDWREGAINTVSPRLAITVEALSSAAVARDNTPPDLDLDGWCLFR
jgi:hypothetical protein